MFDAVTVVEDSDRGLVLSVPPAPTDPYATVSVYVPDRPADENAMRLIDDLIRGDHGVEVQRRAGVLTITASCPLPALRALADEVGGALAALGDSDPAEAGSDGDPEGAESDIRRALFVDTAQADVTSDGLVAAVCGDPADAAEAASALLDRWPGRGDRRRAVETSLRDRPLPVRSDPPSEYQHVTVGCPAVARDDPRYRACALAAVHLAAVDGPVAARLRTESAMTYTLSARMHPELGTGWFSLGGVVRGHAEVNPAEVFVEELIGLGEGPPDDARLAALRVRLTTRIGRSLSDNRGRCSDVTSSVLFGLPLDHQAGIVAGIAATARDDLAAAARSLDLSRLVVRTEAVARG